VRVRFIVLWMLWVGLAHAFLHYEGNGIYTYDRAQLSQERITIAIEEASFTALATQKSEGFWQGRIEGDSTSYCNILYAENALTGVVHLEGLTYALSAIDASHATLTREDTSPRADDRVYIPQSEMNTSSTTPKIAASTLTDDGSVIDVLVVYTSDASNALGGVTQINAEINKSIIYANEALANSCATFRYRLVATGQVNYAEENDIFAALYKEQNGTINLAGLPETYKADLVQMVIKNGNGYCGLAFVYGGESYSANYGYSVVALAGSSVNFSNNRCPTSTVAHELGHNGGLSHDRYETTENLLLKDGSHYAGYGFVDTLHRVRSIMSYSNECSALGLSCEVVPYYSNPDILRDGTPFGVAGTVDAVSILNTHAKTIANYRKSADDYTLELNMSACQEQTVLGTSNCFIATAAYGSYMESDVRVLRDFRDSVLLPYTPSLVAWYYDHSPAWARYVEAHPWAAAMVRGVLGIVAFILAMPWVMLLVFGLLGVWIFYRRRKGRA